MTVTRPTSTEDILSGEGRADFEDIVTRIADASAIIDREREIPQELIDAMVEQGLFRLLVPRSVGGGEIDYLDYLSMGRTSPGRMAAPRGASTRTTSWARWPR